MKTTYFNTVIQKSTEEYSIMISVIPTKMLGAGLPSICEVQSFMMPQTIYTGTYPNIRINTDAIKDRADLIGMGINGIITQPIWYTKEVGEQDVLGISL